MPPAVVLLLIVAVPIVMVVLLRANAALVFLSLCLGDVLQQFVARDTHSIVEAVRPEASDSFIRLGLLLAPAILTAIFMIGTVRRRQMFFNILPAIGVGLLIALLGVPLLSSGLAVNIISSSAWQQLQRSQDIVVGLSALASLLFLWLQRPKTGGKLHGKHKG